MQNFHSISAPKDRDIHFHRTEYSRSSASFTLEAALLMGAILPVLLALCYLCLYDHDCGVLQGAACEMAAAADNSVPDSGRGKELKTKASSLASDAVLSTRGLKTSFSLSEDQVSVSYSGTISLPGFILQLFDRNTLTVSGSCSRSLLHPSSVIRKIKGLRYLDESLKGEKHPAKAGG